MSERRLSIFSIGPTPPSSPFFGEKWLRTIDMVEFVWVGAWLEIAGKGLLG